MPASGSEMLTPGSEAVGAMAARPADAEPFMDPERSLGWRDGPLDGLSCLLRCVEAALRGYGFDQRAVAWALAVPIDIAGGRRDRSRFRHGHLRWRNAADGREHWPELMALVGAGVPVLLMPDRFYWPGDEFEGRRHFLDHMVLAVRRTSRTLEVLDTDAPPADGYRRRLEITDALMRSACRFTTVHFDHPMETGEHLRRTLLVPAATWLAEDLPAVWWFARRWHDQGIDGPTARALHVHVLGEWQPALFLTSLAAADDFPPVAAAFATAARAAQALGKALLGAHRFGGVDPADTTVYAPVARVFEHCAAALDELSHRLRGALGTPDGSDGRGDGPDTRLWDRVTRTRDWCYADQVATERPSASPGRPA